MHGNNEQQILELVEHIQKVFNSLAKGSKMKIDITVLRPAPGEPPAADDDDDRPDPGGYITEPPF